MVGLDWVSVAVVDVVFSGEDAAIIMKNSLNDKNFLIHISAETGNILANLFQKQNFKRPDTFILLSNCITSLGASIHSITIEDATNGVFFAKIVLSKNGNLYHLDARPSDAIALAIVNNLQVFTTKNLIKKTSLMENISTKPDQQITFLTPSAE